VIIVVNIFAVRAEFEISVLWRIGATVSKMHSDSQTVTIK